MIRTYQASEGPIISICVSILGSNNHLRNQLCWQRFAPDHPFTISGQMIHYAMSVLRASAHLGLCGSKQHCFVIQAWPQFHQSNDLSRSTGVSNVVFFLGYSTKIRSNCIPLGQISRCRFRYKRFGGRLHPIYQDTVSNCDQC